MSRATEGPRRARQAGRKAGGRRRQLRAGEARYYVVEVDGTGTVGKKHGPFAASEHQAEARRIHGRVDDDTLLLLARVTGRAFTIENMSQSFLEGDDEGEE